MTMGRRGNGEGSITKRQDGLYMARYTVETATGKKRKTIYAKTRREAAEKMTKAMADRDGGLIFEDENMRAGEYLDTWLKRFTGSVRQSTLEGYEIAVRVHFRPALGRLKLKKLTPAHVASFYQDKLTAGAAPASVNKLHVTLHKTLDQAVKWNMIPRNVSEAVKAPRPVSEEMRTLSAGQVRAMLRAAHGDRLEALYVLAVHTGMRQGELLALKWPDVNLRDGRVSVRRTITKSGGRLLLDEPKTAESRRTISLTTGSLNALRAHRKRQLEEMMQRTGLWHDHGLVFASEAGALINPTNLRRRHFAALLNRAGLPADTRFHHLRHTCATLLLGKGVHPKFVQELLGHANVAITLDTYSHVIPGMGDATACAMEDAVEGDQPEVQNAEDI
jgi:integrase